MFTPLDLILKFLLRSVILNFWFEVMIPKSLCLCGINLVIFIIFEILLEIKVKMCLSIPETYYVKNKFYEKNAIFSKICFINTAVYLIKILFYSITNLYST